MSLHAVQSGNLSELTQPLVTLFQINSSYMRALATISESSTQTWILAERSTVTAWISSTHPERGYIGLCRSASSNTDERAEDFHALLEAARLWLWRQSVREIYAPVDGSTWFQYRLSQVSRQNRRFLWEPDIDAGLEEALLRQRFHRTAGYHSTGFETSRMDIAVKILESSYLKAVDLGLSLVPLSQMSLGDAAPRLYEIATQTFRQAYLYEPLSYESFRALYVSRLVPSDDNLSFVLLSPERDILGFIYAFCDQDLAVVKTVAVLEQVSRDYLFGRAAPSLALLYAVLNEARVRGLKGGVSALVHKEASSTTMERFQRWTQSWRNEYHLFKATI